MVDQVQCPACGAKVDVPETGNVVICPFCRTEFEVGAADASTGVAAPTGDVRVVNQPPEIVEPLRQKEIEKAEEIRREAEQTYQSGMDTSASDLGAQEFPSSSLPPSGPQVYAASDVTPTAPPRSSNRTILIIVAIVIAVCLLVACGLAALVPAVFNSVVY